MFGKMKSRHFDSAVADLMTFCKILVKIYISQYLTLKDNPLLVFLKGNN